MHEKTHLVELLEKEFATTLKAMRAFPEDELEFKPHERSSSAKTLMSTFVFEMYLLTSHVLGEEIAPDAFQTYAPEDLETIIRDFESHGERVVTGLREAGDDILEKKIEFAGKEFVARDFIMMMLHDQIHHRGQLTVYIRLAGGKVPAIYGPSADDPNTNL